MLVGQGIEAGGYHPAADLLADEETLERLAHIREVVAQTGAHDAEPGRVPPDHGSKSEVALRRAS